MDELIEKAKFEDGDIFVLGCSTSEVKGKHIGKDTDIEVGELIVETIKEKLDKIKVNFAVQCCEHLNRALVVEKEVAVKNNFEIVRLSIKEIGNAHLTALTSRPKLIGGSRAVYQ